MRLLISTPLQIFLVDPNSRQISVLRAGDGYYYGITYKDGIFVLTHSGGYLGYFGSKRHPFFTFDHLVQPHQVEWLEERILVANTGKNCLSVFTEDGELYRDVFLNEIRWDDKDRGRAGNHFNSVHKVGNRVFVVAHNYERPSEVWELSWPGLEVVGTITTHASWAHNLWAGELGLIICNSKYGSLQDVYTGETIWASNEDGAMARGLAVSEDYLFIGFSSYNERKERYWKDGGVWIVDRKTMKTLEKITFPGSGDVHEIRLVGVSDACHNGQIIPLGELEYIRRVSPLVAWAYHLRRMHPTFRRDLFPFSQLVRGIQMTARWRRAISNGR